MDEFTMKLNIALSEEDWNILTDAELEHTNTIEFTTPSQKKIMFQKVKHGKWMHDKDNVVISGYCSLCRWTSCVMETDVSDMPFCPQCGATMDEKGEYDGND